MNAENKIFWQLESDCNILKLHGSEKVRENCEDILAVLTYHEYDVDWGRYPSNIQEYRDRWVNTDENGIAYGWTERVTGKERIIPEPPPTIKGRALQQKDVICLLC